LTRTLEVPVLIDVTVPDSQGDAPAWAKDTSTTSTLAELVNDPNRPKTNPAMAMAAMRVMAIRITVAKTGLIAFLRLALLICILCYLLYEKTPVNGTCPPFERAALPVNACPEAPAAQVPIPVKVTAVAAPVAGMSVAVIVGEQVVPP